jgi:putative transposase
MDKATKTIKAKILHLTKIKEKLLSEEYENLQKYLCGEKTVRLYSANKQQAKRYYKKIKPNKEYPLSIRKDLIKIEKRNTKIAKYWVRIPVVGRRGGIWVAIKPHNDILSDYEIGESKVFRKNGEWYIHITVSKEVELKENYAYILAVDIGERVMACVCGTWNSLKPIFYGKEVRGIRRHYAWLRRRLQEKKLLKKVKQIGNKERRIVNDLLHRISKEIVNLAKEHNAIIVMGNLKGIRKSAQNKGERVRRIVNSWAYFRLQKYIEYKALWEGIKVIYIDERRTSITCHRCGAKGKRKSQGCFECPNCRLRDFNADLNGARNILKRFSAYMVENGAVVNQPLTLSLSRETIGL